MPDLGTNLTASEFVQESTDVELLLYVLEGRSASDPASVTGRFMPPKGGNPDLTEQHLVDIIAYMRTLE